MKWVKRIIIALVLGIIVLVIGVTVYLKTLDTNTIKAQIISKISAEIDREVLLKDIVIHFSIMNGVTLRLSGLTIADDPQFSLEPIISVDLARINVDVLPFLINRQVFISRIEFHSPQVNFIRNNNGVFNFQKIAEKEKIKSSVNGNSPVETEPKSSQRKLEKKSKSFSVKEILVRSIQITRGRLNYIDHTGSSPVNIPVEQLNLEISNLSSNQSFPIELSAALWNDTKNIRVTGLAQFDMRTTKTKIKNMVLKVNLSDLALNQLYESIPVLGQIGLVDKLKGRLTVDVEKLTITKKGLVALSSEGRLTDGYVQIKNVPLPIENLNMHLMLSESDFRIKSSEGRIADGKFSMTGKIDNYLSQQKFRGTLNLSDIQLEQLTANLVLPAKLKGHLNANFSGNGVGLSSQALASLMVGDGFLEIIDGRVVDINILKVVLSKLSFIPNLSDNIENNLPKRFQEKLKKNDTILEKVEIKTLIRNNALNIKEASLNADGFLVKAKGKLSFDSRLVLDADLYIPRDLSASMVAVAGELGFLLDEKMRIHIPFKQYRGALKRLRMSPDVESLGLKVIRNKGRDELKKVIFRALDLEGNPVTQPQEGIPEGQTQGQEPKPEEVIIEQILDMIPIFE